MIVVADTSPLNYLILIGHIDVLPALYGSVVIPPAVRDELRATRSPDEVKDWIDAAPTWLEIRTQPPVSIPFAARLDAGEREAIALAHTSGSQTLLLIDERQGRAEARRLGIKITGILGVLLTAHRNGLLDFQNAIAALQETSFNATPTLLDHFLRQI